VARHVRRFGTTVSQEMHMALTLTSPSFRHNGPIPEHHTCDGADTPPPLEWSGAPQGTKSFALIVDDPDAPDPKAPQRTYVHWVLYDIPASVSTLADTSTGFPKSARQGTNDWNRTGYGGPCPPVGRHRYFFKLYALDTTLGGKGAMTKAQLEKAMDGHVIEKAELVGTYERAKVGAKG
jgi:Raf kinase inhibitor-like YbhB/YbcL family protein